MKKSLALIVFLFAGIILQAQTVDVTYYRNGQVKTSTYTEGNISERVTYFKTGGLKEVAHFKNGVANGHWQQYDKHETLVSQGNYLNGKKAGIWLVYNDIDSKVYQITYRNNFKVDTQEWARTKQ